MHILSSPSFFYSSILPPHSPIIPTFLPHIPPLHFLLYFPTFPLKDGAYVSSSSTGGGTGGRSLPSPTAFCRVLVCSDDDDKKSPVLARRMATLLGTAKHRDPPSSASGIWRSNAGVTTIDLELDAPDDVVDVVRRPSGVTVELVDTVTLSDASLDRIASARATAIQPSPATTPVQSQSRSLSCVQPACEAPCVEQCPGTMAEVACEPAPEARCARSLERLGVTCPYQCDDVSPVVAAGECPVSTTDQMCQTEPVSSPGSLRCSLAGSLDTGTETETDFDELYSDEPDNAPTVSCRILSSS